MDKNLIIAVVLGVLLLVAAVQAVELFGLKNKIASGGMTATSTGGNAQLPGNLQNLPSMVGGC